MKFLVGDLRVQDNGKLVVQCIHYFNLILGLQFQSIKYFACDVTFIWVVI
jgi:hypothetical protein